MKVNRFINENFSERPGKGYAENTFPVSPEKEQRVRPPNSGILVSQKGDTDIRKGKIIPLNSFLRNSNSKLSFARRLTPLARKVAECEGETVRIRTQLDSLKPWLKLDVSMKLTGTRQTTAFIGTISEALTQPELLGRLAAQAPEAEAVHAEIISTSTDQTVVFVLCEQSQRQMVGVALRAIGFSLPAVSAGTVPEEESRRLQEKLAAVSMHWSM